jgi:WD40 repeat protein
VAVSEPNQIKLWDTQTGKGPRSIQFAGGGAIEFSRDSRILVAATGSAEANHAAIKLWDTATLAPLAEFSGSAGAFTFSPDSRLLAVFSRDAVTIWDVRDKEERTRLKVNESTPSDLGIYSSPAAAFSPDGKLFCFAGDLTVHVWDTSTGERLGALKGHRDHIRPLAWSPDGKTLATASGPIVKLWNAATREELTTFVAGNGVYFLQFAPDGSLAAADAVNTVRLWRPGE